MSKSNYEVGKTYFYYGDKSDKVKAVRKDHCKCGSNPDCKGYTVFERSDGSSAGLECGFKRKRPSHILVKTQQEEVFTFKVKR